MDRASSSVAIDVSCALGSRTGVGLYAANLTRALVSTYADCHFHLFASARTGKPETLKDLVIDGSNVDLVCRRDSQALNTLKWTVFGLDPIEDYVGKVDVVHG